MAYDLVAMRGAEESLSSASAEALVGWGELIDAERIRVVFRLMPIALTVTMINVVLILAVMSPAADPAILWWWAALVAFVSSVRLGFWRAYRRNGSGTQFWMRVSTFGALAAGTLWGIGTTLIYPGWMLHQLFLAFVIGGMCAGAVTVSSAHFASLAAFVLPATLPLAARFIAEGDRLHVAMGAMALIFAAAMLVIGNLFGAHFTETFRLQFALADRGRALDRINETLREEISRHKATEASLRQAQKLEALGRLTGGIAHDFNNVLTGVVGFVGIALRRIDKDSHLRPLLENALRAADRGTTLTQRLLAFARKQTLNPRPIDLAMLVQDMRSLIEQAVGAACRIEFEFAPGPVVALVDSGQLELAILNLAINARDAMPEGGTLTIDVSPCLADGISPPGLAKGDYAVVTVTDTGTGMDEETLANAFEPFFTTKPAGAGSGLGLSMVQGFAAQSGGTIELTSRKGKGTRAAIWLPRAIGEAIRDARATQRVSSAAPARILVCDDDSDARAAVAEMLCGEGHTVIEAASAAQALQMISAGEAVDILVTDYAMPIMSGADLAAEAARLLPGLKSLLISGHPAALRDESLRSTVLPKPFSPTVLADRIARLQE
jgi:signal transduction histidine kinase